MKMNRRTCMIILATAVIAAAIACIVLMEADDSDAATVSLRANNGTWRRDGSNYNQNVTYEGDTAPGSSFTYDGHSYTLTRNNYGFMGWARSDSANAPDFYPGDALTGLNNNTRLYAVWGRVVFNAGSGTIYMDGSPLGSTTLTLQNTVPIEPPGDSIEYDGHVYTFVRDGYGIIGWNTSNNSTTPRYVEGDGQVLPTITSNYSYYYPTWAQATFNVNGGTIYKDGTASGGTVLTVPINNGATAPGNTIEKSGSTYTYVRDGYALAGWATTSGATTPAYRYGDTLIMRSTQTYYAVWTEVVITINANGGGLTHTDGSSAGSTVTTAPGNITKAPSTLFTVEGTGYIINRAGFGLLGWATSSSATTPTYACDADLPDFQSSTTLFAVWAKGVTFDANGGTVTESGGVTMPAFTAPLTSAYTAPGYVFKAGSVTYTYAKLDNTRTYVLRGWATSSSATVPDYRPGDSIPASATEYTLYAVWSSGIIFDPNGGVVTDANGNPKAPYVMTSYEPLYVPGYTFTLDESRYIYSKQGATFLGWSTDPDALQGEYTEGNILPPSDTGFRLYAIWTRDSYPLTLVYSDTYSVTVNVPYKFKMDLTSYMKYNTGMEDYRIVGWCTDPMDLTSGNRDDNGAYRIQTTGTRYNQYVTMDSVYGMTLYPIWAKVYTSGNNAPVNISSGTGCYYITGTSTTGGEITVTGGTPYIFVDNANITSASKSAFTLTGGTRIELTVIGESTFRGASDQNSGNNRYIGYAGISVASGTTLTVSEYSVGRLSAYGGDAISTSSHYAYAGAGIGANGSYNTLACGTIVINGGTVLAVGGALIQNLSSYTGNIGSGEYSGAGIGGDSSVITINGGVVTAAAGAMYGKYLSRPSDTNTYVVNGGIEGDPINSNNVTISPDATVYQYDSTGGTTNIPDPIKIRFSPYDESRQACTIGEAYGLTVNGYSIDLAGMTIKTNTEVEIPRYMVEDGEGNILSSVSIILTTGHDNYFTGTGTWSAGNNRYNAPIYEQNDEPHGSINIYANEQKITGNETWGTLTPSTDTTVAGTGSYVTYDFVISLNEGYEFGGLEKKSGGVWQEYNIGTGESIEYGDMMVTITLRIPISTGAGSTTDISFTVTQIKKTVSIECSYSEGAHTYDVALVTTDNTDAGTIVWASGNASATHKVYYKSTVTYTLTNHDNTNHYHVQLITVNGVTIAPEVSNDGTQYSFVLRDVCDDTAINISLRPTYRIDMTVRPIGGAVCTTAYVSIVDENGDPIKGLVRPSNNNSYFYYNANSKVYFKINDYTEDTSTGDILGISNIQVAMYDGAHLVSYTIPSSLLDTYSLDVLTGNATITVEITSSNKTITYVSFSSDYEFEVKEGSYISLPTEEELFDRYGLDRKIGFDLISWMVGDITLSPGSQYHVTNDVTFTAYWSGTPHQYEISFEMDGGQSRYKIGDGEYQTITTGTVIFYTVLTEEIRIEAATRTGYTFAGWQGPDITPGSESIVLPKSNARIGDRVYSVVRWDPTTITITYDKNNDDSTIVFNPPTFTRLFGSAYGDLPIYSNFETNTASYSFAGWATDEQGIHRVSPTTKVSDPENHTIYIVWIVNNSNNRIINVVNDGTYGGNVGVNTRTVSPPGSVTVTMEPFTGYEVSSISVNDVVTPLTPGTTQYVVNIPDDSGSQNPVIMYYIEITQYNDTYPYPTGHTDYFDTGVYDDQGHPYFTIESQPLYITRSTVGTYAQHAFIGWTGTGISGTETNYIPIPTGSIGDRLYVEVWEASMYSITYHLQDDVQHPASHNNPSTYRTGTALPLSNPKRTGYIALGWFTAAEGGTKIEVIPANSAEDLVLYAQWAEARAVAKPDVANFLYDGTSHTGVTPHQAADADGYRITGDVTKTYAGTYTVTVTLEEGYYWAGESEETRFDTLTLTWNITKRDLYIISESAWAIYNGSALPSTSTDFDTFGLAPLDSARIVITTNGNSYTNPGRYVNTVSFTGEGTILEAVLSYNIHVFCGSYVIVSATSTTLTIEIDTPASPTGRAMTVFSGHLLDSQPANVLANPLFLRRQS